MIKYAVVIVASLVCISLAGADKLRTSEVEVITEQYIEALMEKDFSKWSQLMLSTGGLDETEFKKKFRMLTERGVPFKEIKIEDIDRTKTGFDICLEFNPRRVVVGLHEKYISYTRYWVQMLPDGTLKYDILIPHPIPFAMSSCSSALRDVKNQEAVRLNDFGAPMFGYRATDSFEAQRKAVMAQREWLLHEGEDWDLSDPRIPCPEELYKTWKGHLKN